MLPRRKSRILALCMLYALDLQRSDELSVARRVEDLFSRPFPDVVTNYAVHLVKGVLTNAEKIDDYIFRHTRNWASERLAMVDRQIMRVAVFEFALEKNPVPAVASINEAVEIAKIFGTEESGHFINGILDAVNAEVNHLERKSGTETPVDPEKKTEAKKLPKAAYLAKYAAEATQIEKEKAERRAAIEADREAEREARRKEREAEWEARRKAREEEKEEY